MRYRILGPLAVLTEEQPRQVGGPQRQTLLGLLLLHANRVVTDDRLIEQLWGDRTPATARGLLHGCVAHLRRALCDHKDSRQPLVRCGSGYVLKVVAGELDRDRFDELANASAGNHSLRQRAARLTEALALWRGPVLDGVALGVGQPEAMRLEERRLAVLEERLEIDLRLGRHTEVVAELRSHVLSHPLREHFWALLMLALDRSGRQADALAAYRQLRDILITQLGVEPSATARELHQRILTGSGSFDPDIAALARSSFRRNGTDDRWSRWRTHRSRVRSTSARQR